VAWLGKEYTLAQVFAREVWQMQLSGVINCIDFDCQTCTAVVTADLVLGALAADKFVITARVERFNSGRSSRKINCGHSLWQRTIMA
jgi:hypothetical protein